ncbi:hypothetical protein FJT64_016650 [Amphibalanus amphitrite]|uniref:Uncharacterized protein n=1 Tax=Amphibalanus amphitrite TaxID=1232801 RepID=A0A6A4X8T4_AMPAM|nr:hypothetical protein FJT64_016650 [Amphibalanus amphitrite]
MTEEKGAKGKLTREDLDIIKEALLEAAKEDMFQQLIQAKEEEMRELREELDDTKTRLNELEQYSRRLCLNVSGVPEAPGEDTNQIVTDLAKMAGVNVAPRDLDVSHRVGAPHTWLAAPLPPADRRSPLSLSALLCLSAPLYPAFLELDCAVNGVCLPGLSALTADPCYWLGELHARYSERPAPAALSVRVH